ncbi:MAG TPA: amino acid-binding protein [Polyangia bacterium]
MKIQQLSIFAENKPGHIAGPCRLLAEKGVDIRALALADTQKFGILRLIVSDPAKATKLLEAAGFVVKATEVLAIAVADQPGGLAQVLDALEGTAVNIEYMYAFPFGHEGKAVLIFRFDNPDGAIKILQAKGVPVLAGDVILKG